MEATGITLFGKKITCYDSGKFTNLPVSTTTAAAGFDTREHSEEDQLRKKTQEDGNSNTPTTEDVDPDTTKTETESDATNSQLNCLKKPDKILPCPRCKSMDTKFCYYNNYNVKQPRHFCKSCQRYWTAGGTMRTMPIGAGRRRNKTPISHCRFETIYQEAFHSAQIQVSNGVPRVPPKFLSFGLDLAHVDSVVSCRDKENGDECSSGSTVTTSNSVTEKSPDRNGFHSQVPCISPGVSWSYNPWNSAIPIPSIFLAGYTPMPMAIYPSPYWNYIPSWLPISSPTQNDINLSVLGKHSPEPELIKLNSSEEPKKQKNSVLIPKTRRIDEAADSSIWSTLGIKNDNISTQGLFKAFQTKGEENTKHPVSTTSPVLQANPAALSRLFCFQERV